MQSDAPKKRCLLSIAGSNDRSDRAKSDEENDDGAGTANENLEQHLLVYLVYYTILINGWHSQVSRVNVNKGDEIDWILDRIKKYNFNTFANVPAYRIELFETAEQEATLNVFCEWNPTVIWGTKQQPFVVKINNFGIPPSVTINGKFVLHTMYYEYLSLLN